MPSIASRVRSRALPWAVFVLLSQGHACGPVTTYDTSPYRPTNDCTDIQGPFGFSCRGPIPGMACLNVNEPADPDGPAAPYTWRDNFFCTAGDMGARWSNGGPIPGMQCINTHEPAEPRDHTWWDNFICFPPGVQFQGRPIEIAWSNAGRIPDMHCDQWLEPGDPYTWSDNFLCWRHVRW